MIGKLTVLIAVAILLASCSGPATLAPTLVPTGTATPPPSATPAPTLAPETSTPEAPTETPETPTSEGTASPELSCKVLSQSVRNGHHFDPRERFTVGWSVRNDGTATWDAGSVDFEYFSGTKMYRFSPEPLPASVAPHTAPVALSADMVAPRNPGNYTTIWTLRRGPDAFCRVSLSIVVP